MTWRELLNEGRNRLDGVGIRDSATDSRLLLEHATGKNRAWHIAHESDPADPANCARYEKLIGERCRRIPLQHITGVQNFMGLDFRVNPDVLVPRQDTETLVEAALKLAKPGWRVLDVCTGSGCIAVSMKHYMPDLLVTGSDISEKALRVAEENAVRLLADVTWLRSDLLETVPGTYHMILSNPPYIPGGVIGTLEPEVAEHDPRIALDGGPDGLDFYRRLADAVPDHLERGGWFLTEIGYDQGRQVKRWMEQAGFCHVSVMTDLAGLDRVVAAQKG